MVHLASTSLSAEGAPVADALAALQAELESGGLDVLTRPGWRPGNLAAPRMLEVGAALSRLRSLQARQLE
jgi:hypothetical protein